MFTSKHIKAVYFAFFVLLSGIILTPFFMFAQSSQPSEPDKSNYCISCHVMQSEYEAWIHSGAHRRKDCVDCHLPNENKAVHYLRKSIDGLKDVIIYYSGRIPEQIKISSYGEKALQANCVRCHETTVTLMDKERKCWSCHKRISHLHTGVMETS